MGKMLEHEKRQGGKGEIQWHWVLYSIHLYMLGAYGLYSLATNAMWLTVFYAIFITYIGMLGVTVGAHRLWAHQAFEAEWYIKLSLMLAHTIAGVGPIYNWVLDHRVHHKYYGTNKDPFNHNKGFLHSHLIANVTSRPADYENISKAIDMRDLETDVYVSFQRIFYWPLFIILSILLPINAPIEYWGESTATSVMVIGFFRLALLRNICWLIQSGVHIWALKPHEKFPPDHHLTFLISKSYWHSYHYLLPTDWKCGEFGSYDDDISTTVLKILKIFNFVSGMKSVSSNTIRERLYELASSKKNLNDVLDEMKTATQVNADEEKLRYQHH